MLLASDTRRLDDPTGSQLERAAGEIARPAPFHHRRQVRRLTWRKRAVAISLCALSTALAACASYSPEPLPTVPDLGGRLTDLVIRADEIPLPELRSHRFDPRRPL